MKKTVKVITVILMVAAAIMAVISWFVLPESVAVQIGMDGKVSNTMPKTIALAIPTVMALIGGFISLTAEETSRKKGFLLLCIGIVILAVMFLLNRVR